MSHRPFRGLYTRYVVVCNILFASTSEEGHHQHLCLLFERLELHGLLLNMPKCAFGTSELEFLGNILSKDGIHCFLVKVKVAAHFSQSTSRRKMWEFLGLLNFHWRFVP